jgi:hypothetical protein
MMIGFLPDPNATNLKVNSHWTLVSGEITID